MTSPRLRRFLIAAAVVNLAGLGALSAAPADAQGMRPPPRCEDAPAFVAGALAFLETKLEVQPEQMRAWQTFAQDVRSAILPLDAVCRSRGRGGRGPAGSDPVQVLDERATPLLAAASTANGLREAVRRVASQLSPEQREILAAELDRPMPPGLGLMPPPPPREGPARLPRGEGPAGPR